MGRLMAGIVRPLVNSAVVPLGSYDGLVGAAPTPTYDPDADALFARMTAEPDASRKGLINDLIVSLKDAAVWERLDGLYLLAAHDAQAARLNWVADEFNLNAMNSPVFTADRGYQGDGSSAYLSTGFVPSAAAGAGSLYQLNSAHLGGWNRTEGQVSDYISGPTSGGSGVYIQPRSSTGNLVGMINGSASLSIAIPSAVGHSVINRSGAATRRLFKNGAQVASDSEASVGLNATALLALRGFSAYSARQIAALHFGASLTTQNVADLHAALNAYMQAIGAAA